MLTAIADVLAWTKMQFSKVNPGDARRTNRAVRVAASRAGGGSGNVPLEAKSMAEARAACRLFDQEGTQWAKLSRTSIF